MASAPLTGPFRLPEAPEQSDLLAKYFRGFGVLNRIADPRVLHTLDLARALLEDNADHVAACCRIDDA